MFSEELTERIISKELALPTEAEISFLNYLKSGKNILIEGVVPHQINRLLTFSLLSRISKPEEGSPRAIWLTSSNEEAVRLGKELAYLIKMQDVTVDLANEKGNILQQRNDIFDGTEIIIGNLKRVHELYIQNGINFNKVKYFFIEDMEEMMRGQGIGYLNRILEGLPKCQIVIICKFKNEKIDKLIANALLTFEVMEFTSAEE